MQLRREGYPAYLILDKLGLGEDWLLGAGLDTSTRIALAVDQGSRGKMS